MRQYLAEDLIQVVRDRVVTGQAATEGTQDADILRIINDEALGRVCNAVMHVREEYYVNTIRQSITAGMVRYRIPHRAMQGKIRDIFYLDSDNNRYKLLPVPREFRAGNFKITSSESVPSGYYFEGNHIVLHPDSSTSISGTLEISYYFRPGELVLSTEARTVASINSGVIVLNDDVPAGWTTGETYDIHSPHSGAEIKAWDLTASAVSGSQITFSSTSMDGSVFGTLAVEVGDWVCLAEEAALPGLPREWHPVLAQAATVAILETIDPERFQIAVQGLERSIERMYEALHNRDESYSEAVYVTGSAFTGGI
jgi:hypothetical protein